MVAWRDWVLEIRLAIRSIVRLCRRYMAKAFASWRFAVEESQRQERLRCRMVARVQKRRIAAVMVGWRGLLRGATSGAVLHEHLKRLAVLVAWRQLTQVRTRAVLWMESCLQRSSCYESSY
jgi:hypothetical protein